MLCHAVRVQDLGVFKLWSGVSVQLQALVLTMHAAERSDEKVV